MKIILSREAIEQFHLLFLEQLGYKLNKNFYRIKGGCNLRFFFKSPRYSEDLDIDIQTVATETLKKNVRQILASRPFSNILKAKGLEIASMSEPKQTDTTQRWKITLKTASFSAPLHTKIEFSRRGFSGEGSFERVDDSLIRHYRLSPFLISHYPADAAWDQKIKALLGRSETQARDLFDLYILGPSLSKTPAGPIKDKTTLREKILSIHFEDFKGQVWAYLSAEWQKQYSSMEAWNHIVDNTLQRLGLTS